MKYQLKSFHRDVPNEDLIQDLQKVYSKLKSINKKLTFRNYNENGKYSASTISERFGTWNGALEAANISPIQEKNITIEELFDNLRSVWIARGRQPVFRNMNVEPSRYTASTYAARFGGWRNALIEFMKSISQENDSYIEEIITKNNRNIDKKRTARIPSLRIKFKVMRRDRFRCNKCGRSPATNVGLQLEVDHILAWSKGGETILENLQTLCFDCNRGKSNLRDSN